MCMKAPKVTPTPSIVDRSDPSVSAARDRRIQLGNQTGGRLATRHVLGYGASDARFKLGG